MEIRMTKVFKKNIMMCSFGISILAVVFALAIIVPNIVKASEDSITVKEIDYEKSTITFQLNPQDTKLFISDSSKKVWDEVIGTIGSNDTITMDISWISTSKDYVLNFKGDESTKISSVKLPKRDVKFKAIYNNVQQTIAFSNTSSRTIEWRKKDSRNWTVINTDTISSQLQHLYDNGAMVVFRLAPVKGSSIVDVGMPASKEVSVTIAKRTAAPKVEVNGQTFTIAVSKGMAYRYVTEDGKGDWTNITKTTKYLISDIAPSVLYKKDGTQKEVTIQFRKNATSSSQVSKVSTVIIPTQDGPIDVDKEGISLTYTSSTTLALVVKGASTSTPYEYTVVLKDHDLDYQVAKWTTISSDANVTINNKTAPEGSHIYIRNKYVPVSETAEFKLASAATNLTGANGVVYPALPKFGTLTYMISSAGSVKTGDSSTHKTFVLYSPTSTTVASISLYDSYGVKKGTVTTKSTVALNGDTAATASNRYIITVTVTSSEEIDKYTKELLYAHIALANGDSIISNQTSGVAFYLYPKTQINNDNSSYTKDFKRVYLSKETQDQKSFQFKVMLGTPNVYDTSVIEQFSTTETKISSIKLQDYNLKLGTDYTAEYNYTTNPATALVTINVSDFEQNASILKLDEAIPFEITFNNKEVIASEVKVTFASTATVEEAPISWTITQGSLPETKTVTTTNKDGSTSTSVEDVNSFEININIFSSTYGVSVSNVTWDGQSIFNGATVKNGKGEITLSNNKINKLTTESSDTKDVVITFSNGFVIKKGIKLTVIKGAK